MRISCRRTIKRCVAVVLALTLSTAGVLYAKTDDYIYTDPVAHTYTGRAEAERLAANLRFADMPSDTFLQDAIVRSGVLNIIKAYAPQFDPGALVEKQEAVAFALRVIGMENQAQALGNTLTAPLPPDAPLRTIWALGYLNLARDMGLINAAQFRGATTPDQTTLDPAVDFIRTDAATREEFARWLALAIQYAYPNAFVTSASQQYIYRYSDWESIASDKVASVENLLRAGIWPDDGTGRFRPNEPITRIETAYIFRNMDQIHYRLAGIEKKTGTVGGIADTQSTGPSAAQLWRNVYVRGADGQIDVLQFSIAANASLQEDTWDAVVLKDGNVTGLTALAEGDLIEYLVNTAGDVLYVQVTGGLTSRLAQGRLQAVDLNNGTITLTDDSGKAYVYVMAAGLYGTDEYGRAYINFDTVKRYLSDMSYGSAFNITLTNNIVTAIRYVGEPVLYTETTGIVTENNVALGYLTVVDSTGRTQTKTYNPGNLRVQKTEYYDMRDTIGSIHSLFPDLQYNPRETTMDSIEAGDIVSFRTDPANDGVIISLSAATNYTTRYGRLSEFRVIGNVTSFLMVFENGQSAWFTMADTVPLTKAGRPVRAADIQPGDWAQILVNQAVIAPGYVMESVKEMAVEGDAHYISNIVSGKLAGINTIQNRLQVQNAQILTKTGWADYRPIADYNLAGKNIEYYYEDRPVTFAYVANFLKRLDAVVYIALENNYAGEMVRKVTFRPGRDQLLPADTVLSADGIRFSIIGNSNPIATDAGTIVRRNGRLVDGRNIMVPDYAMVALNGLDTAAVVDITQAPDTSGVTIARGRIYSVDQGRSFKVQSMSMFDGQEWHYTPIQREFAIDYDTMFFDADGIVASDTFIGYTAASVVDRVYNIVIDGSRAARVVDAPYTTQALRGIIYDVEGEMISLRDATYYDDNTGIWVPVSRIDPTTRVMVAANTIIVNRNAVVGANTLAIGDQIKVMTAPLPDDVTGGMQVNGYIILVER